jgi:transcriptional regulator with XRE-family HTH domain
MPGQSDTHQGLRLPARRGRNIPSVVSLKAAQELLSEPIPVAFIAADGTVLACNALAAWLCNVPAASRLLLQNVYEYSANFIRSERIPLACNSVFRFRKLAGLKAIDPGRTWPAHRRLYEAVQDAERRFAGMSCPIAECVQTSGNESWRYPLCIREPDSWPGGAPEQLLQFRVSDSLIGHGGALREVPGEEKRYLIVFEPWSEHTSTILRQKLIEFYRYSDIDDYIAPKIGFNVLAKYLDMSVRNDIQYIVEYVEEMGIMKENFTEAPMEEIESPPDAQLTSEEEGQEQVGPLLRRLRARRHMSSEELAKHLGVSRGAVGHWELGRRTPPRDLRVVRALFDALDPSGAEREQLLKLITGSEVVMEKAGESDEAFYEDILRRTDLIMSLGAHVVALQTELEREATFIRSALQDRLLRSDQGAIPEQTLSGGDS